MRKCDRGKRKEKASRGGRGQEMQTGGVGIRSFPPRLFMQSSLSYCAKLLLACHINKVRSFSGLVSPFLWQIQNVLLKSAWKMSCISAKTERIHTFKKKKEEEGQKTQEADML